MYKVMIVEDMDIIREDIKGLINWQENGYQIVAEARNGEAGLAMFKKHKPDIVITDIKMPVMTGLEMIKEIRSTDTDAQFILLTEYEAFEYAKTALYLNVHSYLLKYQLDPDILLRELEKVRSVIERQRSINRITKTEHIKDCLIHGKQETECPNSFFGWHGLSCLMVVEAKGSTQKASELYSCFRERLSSESQDYEFEYIEMTPQEHVLFLKLANSMSQLKKMNFIRTFVNLLQSTAKATFKNEICVALGSNLYNSGDIVDAYRKAKQLLRYKVFFPGSCFIDSIPPKSTPEQNDEIRLMLQSIKANIKSMKADELKQQIPQLFTCQLPKVKNIELLEECVRTLTFAIANRSEQAEINSLSEVLDEITDCARNYNIFVLNNLFLKAIEMMDADMGSRYSKRIHIIIKYVDEHYQDDITLYDLSKELDLSVIYISQLFKKEVGITFSSYLTKVRIEKAIQMLCTGRYKVYEVSKMVGYQTVQYFSTIFKKETGRRPGDLC